MNKRLISNEEFIELWNVHKSAAKIAKLTGISERNVHHRRRDIEAKHDTSIGCGKQQKHSSASLRAHQPWHGERHGHCV
jgi:hypothetical protein